MPSRRRAWSVAAVVLLAVLATTFAVLAVRVSSRDVTPIAMPGGSEVAQPSLSPHPTVTHTAKPTPTGSKGCKPASLAIPDIHVNAQVLALGKDAGGKQLLPPNVYQVSWFKDGSVPGQPGNAIIIGHTWSQGDGVFDRLSELNVGDIVVVHGNGCALTFRVDTVQPHVPVNKPASYFDELFRTDGDPGLVLYTCGDYSSGAYHSRIVVHAHPVE